MIRVLLAGGSEEARVTLAGLLRERLGVAEVSDGFVLAAPPADLDALDELLFRQGTSLDALIHLGGADDALLERYPLAIVEVRTTEPEDVLSALREGLLAAH